MHHRGLERLDDLLATRLALACKAIAEVLQLENAQAAAVPNNYIPPAVTAATVVRPNLNAVTAVKPI
jgi:hypothetical protein